MCLMPHRGSGCDQKCIKEGIKLETANLKRAHHFVPDSELLSSGFSGVCKPIVCGQTQVVAFVKFYPKTSPLFKILFARVSRVILVMHAAVNFLSAGLS